MEKDAYEGAGSVVLVLQNMLDDLLEIHEMDEDQAAALIMKAREHWFEAEQQAEQQAEQA